MYKSIIFLQIIRSIFGFACKKKKIKSHLITLASKKGVCLFLFSPPFRVGVHGVLPLSSPGWSAPQTEWWAEWRWSRWASPGFETGRRPPWRRCGPVPGLCCPSLGTGVGGKDQICLMSNTGNSLTLLFYISHNGRNSTMSKWKSSHLFHHIFVPLFNSITYNIIQFKSVLQIM